MTGFAKIATDRTLRAWLSTGPVDRGVGDGLTFVATAAGAQLGKASWILRYRYGGRHKEKVIGRFERCIGAEAGTESFDLPGQHRIFAALLLHSYVVASPARLLEAHVRIAAERQALLLAVEAALPEPTLRTRWRDLKVEAGGVSQRTRGLPASQLAFLHCLPVSMGEQHSKWLQDCHLFPQMFPRFRSAAVRQQEPS